MKAKGGLIGKYEITFEEIDFCVSQIIYELEISLHKLDYYPENVSFKELTDKVGVETLTNVAQIFINNEYLDLVEYMSPEVHKFMLMWIDNIEFEYVDMPALLVTKEKEHIITESIIENHDENKRRRL